MDEQRVAEIVSEKLLACRQDVARELHQLNVTLASAFPRDRDGKVDFSGHREYHEQLMEAVKAEALFWKDLRKEILRKGIIGLIIICLGLLTVGALASLKIKLGLGG